MRIKIAAIFIISILIPTALLSYFGLLAVRSEKSIIERSMQERYEFMADIVIGEIETTLKDIPPGLSKNKEYLESILLGEAALFKDQLKILDKAGRAIGGPIKSFSSGQREELKKSVLTRRIADLPYTIAVYERYPLPFLEKLEEKKKGLYSYIGIISFSALSILGGGFFTLWALSREWRLTELKSEFVSGLSHDLRRPLTSIRMFSEMLKDNRLPSEEKRRIYMIDETRQINLEIKDSLPMLKIDADSIFQALINLLSNAAKFSSSDKEIKVNLSYGISKISPNPSLEKRGIPFSLKNRGFFGKERYFPLWKRGMEGDLSSRRANLIGGRKEIVIEIIDQGIGIPQSEQRKIFKRFYRTPQKGVVETEGSGLGLALVKYTARAHGGDVQVKSEEGKGSKFSLILPI